MIFANPEFQRNVWLKFSFFRLIAPPIIIGLIVLLIGSFDHNGNEAIRDTMAVLYVLAVFIWGNYEAASSLVQEGKENTWDFQRMSSSGPWQVALGKLFGSTSYVWYCGAIVLLTMALSGDFVLSDMLYLILAGLMGHATALTLSIDSLKYKRFNLIAPFLFGIIVSFQVQGLTALTEKGDVAVRWWGISDISSTLFILASLCFFFFWIMAALERRIRAELLFKSPPIAWTLFVVTFTIYAVGIDKFFLVDGASQHWSNYVNDGTINTIRLFFAFIITGFFCYLAVFQEASNFGKYRRFFLFWREKNTARVWENTPTWLPTAAMMVLCYFGLNIHTLMIPAGSENGGKIWIVSTAIIFFLLRDGLFFHFVLLGNRINHARFVIGFYALIVYILLPFLIMSFYKDQQEQGKALLSLLLPTGDGNAVIGILSPMLQSAAAGWLLIRSLKQIGKN